jgi:hypothetical protein
VQYQRIGGATPARVAPATGSVDADTATQSDVVLTVRAAVLLFTM